MMNRLSRYFQAIKELGLPSVAWYAIYQLGLRSGHYRRVSQPSQEYRRVMDGASSGGKPTSGLTINPALFSFPDPAVLQGILGDRANELIAEADEIAQGQVRLFGGKPVPLQLAIATPQVHWTEVELGRAKLPVEDIKFAWEPARFGWTFTLGRAYLITGDERYPRAFWQNLEIFLDGNPPYLGLQYSSGQEVALRLMAWTFAWQAFGASPDSTTARLQRLYIAIADHAERIPLTLPYARAQNNNHLLSEAAGLYTASLLVPTHPRAQRWRELGWKLFHQALARQITADGVYIQHSANYQRLALQLGLWMHSLATCIGQAFPSASRQKLAAATRWLLAVTDPQTGQVPNLGPNDGAYLFPLTICPFGDYRPVLQAAAQVFLGIRPFAAGIWDEMTLWLGKLNGVQSKEERLKSLLRTPGPKEGAARLKSLLPGISHGSPHVLRTSSSWAYLRAAQFTGRPGHADQLHVDLWWRGYNLAQDAGTYLYNAPAPWDNSLAGTPVHNTLMVDEQEQMQLVGRFLFLGRAKATVTAYEQALDGSWMRLVARHTGYCKLGVIHERVVTAFPDRRWVVEDRLLPSQPPKSNLQNILSNSHSFRLHWLLPDWPWELVGARLRIQSLLGSIELGITPGPGAQLDRLQLVRAGELLSGTGEIKPYWGWVSPTYGVKQPALAFILEGRGILPIHLNSTWILPETLHAA